MHFTTNHHSRPKSVSNPSIDDEACRRLMISLYGSEAAAVAAAQALASVVAMIEGDVRLFVTEFVAAGFILISSASVVFLTVL